MHGQQMRELQQDRRSAAVEKDMESCEVKALYNNERNKNKEKEKELKIKTAELKQVQQIVHIKDKVINDLKLKSKASSGKAEKDDDDDTNVCDGKYNINIILK